MYNSPENLNKYKYLKKILINITRHFQEVMNIAYITFWMYYFSQSNSTLYFLEVLILLQVAMFLTSLLAIIIVRVVYKIKGVHKVDK